MINDCDEESWDAGWDAAWKEMRESTKETRLKNGVIIQKLQQIGYNYGENKDKTLTREECKQILEIIE